MARRSLLRADGTNLTLLASSISAILGTSGMKAAHAQENTLNDEITVTGSRIVRRDLEASSPIMTIDAARLSQSSTIGIESVLNQMPEFVPAGGTQFNSGIQTGSQATLGIGSVNLRGLGQKRTLVLVDGRRAEPADASLVIDINTIPSAAIERVETITGGASAVYGADALAGVVNFILKKDFEGVDMDFQTSTTEQGDGAETRFTALIGVNADNKKGNVMMGVSWDKREAVNLRDRKFYMNGWFDPGSDAPGFPQMDGFSPATNGFRATQAAIDQVFANTPGYVPGGNPNVKGTVTNGQEIYFNPDGTPFAISTSQGGGGIGYNGPIATANTDWKIGLGDGVSGMRRQPNGNYGQVFYEGFASTPLERRSAFGRAHYDITDNMNAFVQANYSHVEVTTAGGYPPAITVWSAPIPNDGLRTIPTALQTLLASRFTPDPDGAGPLTAGAPGSAAAQPWVLFRVLDFLGGPVEPQNITDAYQIMTGVEGRVPNRDWTWEAYVSTGQTQVNVVNENLPSLQRYQSLVAQPNFGVGTFPAARFYQAQCTTGLPIFRATDPSQDCLDSIDMNGKTQSTLKQNIVEANLQGKITDMKSGELRFAAGLSHRENQFTYDPFYAAPAVVENPIGLFASASTAGETKVSEAYGELLLPATKKLNFELGYRFSDYDTKAGSTNTYKTLFDWSATEKLRLRGGYQRAIRAPNTAELFQGITLVVVPFAPSDPCSYTFDHNDLPGTHQTWGNVAANPNRLAVQQLCAAIIGNTTSAFGAPGSAQANNFARPGAPFFPLEIELQRGDAGVGPEQADTYTLGFVLNGPGSLQNLTASVDFYTIHINNAISTLNSLFVYQKCFNADGSSNPTLSLNDPGGYCKKIGRNPTTGERANVDAPFNNSGILETAGVDFAVNWRTGPFYINSLLTYLDKYDTQDAAGAPVIHNKGTFASTATTVGGQFDWKLTSTFGYNFTGGKANVGLQWRYLPSIKDESAARNPNTATLGVGSYEIFSLFAGYSLNSKMQLRMGVDNLADVQPPIYGYTTSDHNAEQTRADTYDVLGRRVYAGIKVSF
ncbi:MAG TPA: TonB-dependent receptor [Gammaproteobacteria bacterium]|nr:TonB-dependent receptor [Gammaproteobacteria bacterium]